jgi:uncharacterized protein (DUF305 family)
METVPSSPADENIDTDDEDVIVLPWYQNVWNIVALVVAAAFLFGAVGYVVGNNRATPDPNEVDIGFLQDMRWHHEQAVSMSLIYLDKPDASNAVKRLARNIVVSQNIEVGRMIELLRDFGAPEAAPTDIGMAWMNEPTELDRMPGMASDSDVEALAAASGAEADQIFVDLMVAHHEGGLHMGEFAMENANDPRVQRFAEIVVQTQLDEIGDLQVHLAGSQGG